MGLLDQLKNIFGPRNDVKSIQSIDNRFKSIEQPFDQIQPHQSSASIAQSTPQIPIPISNYGNYRQDYSSEIPSPPVQKDSYELGLAAGYTGRSIKEIEASLTRIETQMVTKDWFMVHLQQLDRRIEDIERAMGIIKGAIPALEEQKRAVVRHIPLTPRMEDLLRVVKESKEISFSDLALKMQLDISDVRSLLSVMTKRTHEVQRFRIHRAGWVKYVDGSVSAQNKEF